MAILAVLALHAFADDTTGVRPLDVAYRLCAAGWIGVDLFFVLSGFLITSILLHTRGRPHAVRNFYARRALRIFPLYFGLVAVGSIAAHYATGRGSRGPGTFHDEQVWLWTYLVNFRLAVIGHRTDLVTTTGLAGYGQFWSLCVEEHFYLVWPLVVLFCRRRWLPAICGVVLAIGIATRVAVVLLVPDGPFVAYAITPTRLDGLLVGSLMAMAVERPGFRDWIAHRATRLLCTVAAVLVLGWVVTGWDMRGTAGAIAVYTILAFCFAAVVLCCVVIPPTHPFARAAATSTLTTLGRYSYGLYALHVIVFHLAVGPARAMAVRLLHSTTAGDFVARVGVIALSFAAAIASYHLYERPFLNLKRFFPTGRPLAAPSAGPTTAVALLVPATA